VVNGARIDRREIIRGLEAAPRAVRRRFASDARARSAYLERLILREVAHQEGLRLGIDQEPEVRGRGRAAIITAALERIAGMVAEGVTEEDLRRELARSGPEATLAITRAAMVVTRSRGAARQVLERYSSGARDRGAIRELVERYGVDDENRMRGGDVGFVTAFSPHRQEVRDAARSLKQVGDTAGPFRYGGGRWAILVKTAGSPPRERSLEHLGERLRCGLINSRRKAYLMRIYARWRSEGRVQVDGDLLDGIAEELEV
jgi:hypothetical protein